MIDWIFDHVEWFGGAFILFFVLLFYFLFVEMGKDCENNKRLMNQCMSDGHKEYECVSMLRRNSSSTVIPVVVPIR